MAAITKLTAEDDPMMDWRKINEIIDHVNAWDKAVISPQDAGSVKITAKDGVVINLNGVVTKQSGIQQGSLQPNS